MDSRIEAKLDRILEHLSNTEENSVVILDRMTTLERIVAAAVPRTRRTKAAQIISCTPTELLSKRVAELTRIFDKLIHMPQSKRKAQNFPSYLIEGLVDQAKGVVFGAVPESILANRCSMLKIFQPIVAFNEKTSAANAYEAIKEADRLGVVRLDTVTNAYILKDYDEKENAIYYESDARIVMSKECAERLYGKGSMRKVEQKDTTKIEPEIEPKIEPKIKPKIEEHKPESFAEFKERIKREKEQANELADELADEICEECREDLVDGKCPNCKVIDL